MLQRKLPGWRKVQQVLMVATAVGVAIHEYAHKQMAEDHNLAVKEVCLFQFDNPKGYVVHAEPRTFSSSFAVSFAPFLLNTAILYTSLLGISAYMIYTGSTTIETLTGLEIAGIIIAGWIGIAAGFEAFPSSQDIDNCWAKGKQEVKNLSFRRRGLISFIVEKVYVVLAIPIILLLVLLNKTTAFGSKFVYLAVIAFWVFLTLTMLFPDTALI